MNIKFWLNGIQRQEEIDPGMLLIDFLREKGCYSVKRGCETANCGLGTVLRDEKPILSCSMLAARIDGKKIVTLEGLQKEAEEFGDFLANEGAEQCGLRCSTRSKIPQRSRSKNIWQEICADAPVLSLRQQAF